MPETPCVGIACAQFVKLQSEKVHSEKKNYTATVTWQERLIESNLSVGDVLQEKARHGGAEQLGDPVEDAGEDGDVAADGEAKGDGGVQVAAGDVGGHGDTHEERERMGDGDGHKAGGVQSATLCQLRCTRRI